MNAVHSDIGRQVSAVRNRLGSKFPFYAEDIEQEAWKYSLASAARYNPENKGARGYFYLACMLSVPVDISRWLSVTSLSFAEARNVSRARQIREPMTNQTALKLASSDSADVRVILRDAQWRLSAARIRLRREIEREPMKPLDREVGMLAIGVEGLPRTKAQIAKELHISCDRVIDGAQAFKRAIRRRPIIASLWSEIRKTEQETP
jgi:hypothetical protein